MTAEHTSREFDPHATSMGDEVAPEVYESSSPRRSIDNFDAALVQPSRSVFRQPSAWAS